MMNHKDRFLATINREPVDYPACWFGMPLSTAIPKLFQYFEVESIEELKIKIDDDVYPVDVPYHSPVASHIACAFPFAKQDAPDYENRTLTTPGFFEGFKDPERVNDFEWPDPSHFMDPAECRAAAENAPQDFAILGVLWSAHFQDACAAFGMQNALYTMLRHPSMFQAVIDRIVKFYLDANEIFLSATEGLLDAVLIGNDFGGQKGLLLSRQHIQKFVFPGTKLLIDQAKKYHLKVIHHSCGSIFEIIPDLIDLGADAIHPIQALATNMEPQRLKENYGDQISFCGGVDHQHLLVNGTPDQVREKVAELKAIFPTGLIISPSHEAILPDIPPENLAALIDAVKN
jgi:uroporphyrinogen decarboxylase